MLELSVENSISTSWIVPSTQSSKIRTLALPIHFTKKKSRTTRTCRIQMDLAAITGYPKKMQALFWALPFTSTISNNIDHMRTVRALRGPAHMRILLLHRVGLQCWCSALWSVRMGFSFVLRGKYSTCMQLD